MVRNLVNLIEDLANMTTFAMLVLFAGIIIYIWARGNE